MTSEFLFAWWNLIFVVPFLLALLYLGLYAICGATLGETDADADTDADVDAHVDAHMDVHADVDAHGDIESAPDADADADVDAHADIDSDTDMIAHADADHPIGGGVSPSTHSSFHMVALSWLGVGRVPLSLLLMVLLTSWGVIGFLVNAVIYPILQDRSMIPGLSLPAAAVVGRSQIPPGVLRQTGPRPQTLVARTAYINVLVDDFDPARQALDRLVRDHRGYAAHLEITGERQSGRRLTATLRVPASDLDHVLTQLKALGRVEKISKTPRISTLSKSGMIKIDRAPS
jgi:hypothetical protein